MFATLIVFYSSGLWRQEFEKHVSAVLPLNYRRLRPPGIEPGIADYDVVPQAFATDQTNAGDKRSESLLCLPSLTTKERDSNPRASMYSRRHSPANPSGRQEQDRDTDLNRIVVPNSIRPLTNQTLIASMAATQWSGSSSPAEKAAITSNTWSEKPPILSMSSRSVACVVEPG